MLNLHDAQRGFVGSACSLVSTPSMDVMAKLAAGSGPLINQYPSWVLLSGGVPATLDIDFVNDQAWNSPNTATIASLLTCSRASTGYYTKADGTLVSFNNNVLRYGTNGLLVEEARTNLCLRSQQFDNASWTVSKTTISADAVAAPDGTTTADKIQEDNTSGEHKCATASAITVSSGAAYTISVYAKAAERTWMLVYGTAANTGVWFDIGNGALGTQQGSVTSASITALASGWYRCTITFTTTGTGESINIDTATGNNAVSFLGVTGNGVYVWGAQLEAGSFATSYIPTTTASATRAADNITRVDGLFDQGRGTALASFTVKDVVSGHAIVLFSDGTANNRVRLLNSPSPQFTLFVADGGVTQANMGVGVPSISGTHKGAAAWDTNTFNAAYDGAIGALDSSGSVPAGITTMTIGNSSGAYLDGYLKRLSFWNTRLADAALQTLTT